MIHHTILRIIAKLLVPLILLFGLYVQFHGDFGPGGGFQAGVIVAAGVILFALVFDLDRAMEAVPPWFLNVGIGAGALLYAGVGVACMLLGGNFLDYGVLLHDPVHGQHLGIFLVELGVGITVASVMVTIFYAFADRRSRSPDPGTHNISDAAASHGTGTASHEANQGGLGTTAPEPIRTPISTNDKLDTQ